MKTVANGPDWVSGNRRPRARTPTLQYNHSATSTSFVLPAAEGRPVKWGAKEEVQVVTYASWMTARRLATGLAHNATTGSYTVQLQYPSRLGDGNSGSNEPQ